MSLLRRSIEYRGALRTSRPEGGFVKYLAWIDVATTGADERRDPILEVGLIITDPALADLRTHSLVINPEFSGPRYGGWKARLEDSVLKGTHHTNGLLRDLPFGMSLAEGQRFLIETFDRFGGPGDFTLATAGAKARRFLTEQMPKAADYLTRETLDVAGLQRFIGIVAERPDLEPSSPRGRKLGRALFDVQHLLAEARHYRRIIAAAEVPFED